MKNFLIILGILWVLGFILKQSGLANKDISFWKKH